MSKSVLPIFIAAHPADARTIEVPCRLPGAFNFKADGFLFTAYVSEAGVVSVETEAKDEVEFGLYAKADDAAEAILAQAKATLGITGPVPPGSPLQSIALAYEAECTTYDACLNAHRELPRTITGDAVYWSHPSEGRSVGMLAKYVEYVFEQAAKAQEVKS